MKRFVVPFGLLVVLAPAFASADSGKLNLHLDVGIGGAVAGGASHDATSDERSFGGVVGAGLDWQLRPPFALEARIQGGGFTKPFDNASRTGAGIVGLSFGARFRFLDDQRGYLDGRHGNARGNLYATAQIGWFNFDSAQYGFDFSVGYELSVHRPVALGPMIRLLTLVGGRTDGADVVLLAGISTSFEAMRLAAGNDPDRDGLENSEEAEAHTDPHDDDTDGDDLPDGVEVDHDTDPRVSDTDGDGLADGYEDANANGLLDADETDPRNFDTDQGGISDGDEVMVHHSDPRNHHDDDEDGDQVPNDADSCAETPAGSAVDHAGCPTRTSGPARTASIAFTPGRSTISAEGQTALSRLAESLREGRTTLRVFVASTGDATADARLAQRRAEAIANFLASHGVARDRFAVAPIGADPTAGRTTDPNGATVELVTE